MQKAPHFRLNVSPNTNKLIGSFLKSTNMPATEPPPPGIPEEMWSKNRLQQYTQRASMPLPVYQTLSEGSSHAPTFRSRVWVDGTCFTSPNSFSNRKMAEQDAAKLALIGIREKVRSEGSSRILQDTMFCKSIINEYAAKMNLLPTYVPNQSEAVLPIFMSSLVLNGVTYVGDAGKNKKEAEQFAARAAILSILDSESSTTMSEIVKSKFRLYDALKKVKDSSSARSIVPTGIDTLKDIKDSCDIQRGNVPAEVIASGAPLSVNKRKEVHVSGSTAIASSTAVPQSSLLTQLPSTQVELPESASKQPSKTQVTDQSLHEFKKPKCQASSAAIAPPIVFVPPASGQAPTCSASAYEQALTCSAFASEQAGTCSASASGQAAMCSAASGKKRNRKNKKAKKKMQHESPLPIAMIPQSPLPACSVAQ